MRLVVFGDIHGNLPAFEAVLNDIQAQSPDSLLCLGDVAADGAWPRECIQPRVSRHWEDGVLDGLQVSRIQEKSGPDAFQADLGCLELSVFPGHS